MVHHMPTASSRSKQIGHIIEERKFILLLKCAPQTLSGKQMYKHMIEFENYTTGYTQVQIMINE